MDPLVPDQAWNYGTVSYPVALSKDRADHYSLMPVNNVVPKLRWEGEDYYLGDLLGPDGRDLAYDYGSAAISRAEFEVRLGDRITQYVEMGELVEVVWPEG